MVKLIWAMTTDGIIAKDQKLPWNIKAEMAYFQKLTTKKTILMGSKTFESIGKPLKNRYNIIISNHQERYQFWNKHDNVIFTNDLSAILQQYTNNAQADLWVIGGASIFAQTWNQANYLYISIIKAPYSGDLKFPMADFSDFMLILEQDYPEFTTKVYQRKD